MRYWNEVIAPALENIVEDVIGILPQLLGGLVILIVGWILARIMANLVNKLLVRVGFEKIAEKAGIAAFLKRSGFSRSVSWVMGRIVFWTIMMLFLLSALETLRLTALAEAIQSAVSYTPNLLVIILVLIFGSLVAKLVGQLVKGSAESAGLDFGDLLGKLVRNFILVTVFIICVSQLGISTSVIDYIFIAMLGALAVAIALALGLGVKEIARSIIYGVYARKEFEIGQEIKVNDVTGKLVRFGPINALIELPGGKVSIPNRTLLTENVFINKAAEPEA